MLCLQLPFLPEEESRTQGLICEWILSASSWVWACCLWGKFKHRGFFWASSSSGHRASGFLKMLPPHPGHLEGHWEGVWPRPTQATYSNSLTGSRLLSLRILSLWSLVRPSSKEHCLLYCSAQRPQSSQQRATRVRGKWLLCLEASLNSFPFGKVVELQQMSQLSRRRQSPPYPTSRHGMPHTLPRIHSGTRLLSTPKALIPPESILLRVSPVFWALWWCLSLSLLIFRDIGASGQAPVKYFVDCLSFVRCFLSGNE